MLPPPSGFAHWAATFRQVSSGRKSVITMGVLHAAAATAAATRANISNAMVSAGRMLDLATLDDGWVLEQQYVLSNQAGVLTSDTSITNSPGTLNGPVVTPNVGIVINKRTGFAGRQYRGKMTLPAGYLAETNVDEGGVIDSTFLSGLQTRCTSAFNALVTNNVPPYLLHDTPLVGPVPIPTAITSFSANGLVGTQRRRLRR